MTAKYVCRYFQLPALIRLLTTQQFSLMPPSSWDDSNDSHFLEVYKRKKKLSSVLAACFTEATESYHLWHVFAQGPSGACVRFHRKLLVDFFVFKGLRWDKVEYLTLSQLRARRPLRVGKLPFLKRHPFEAENEFRLIYESKTKNLPFLDIPIPTDAIDRITLSPWIPYVQFEAVKELLRGIPECESLKIFSSTLIGNQEWKDAAEGAIQKKSA